MGGVTDYVNQFLQPKNLLARGLVKELEAKPFDTIKHWDWHNLARYYWAFRNQQAAGVNAVRINLKNELAVGFVEIGITTSRGPDEFHHVQGFYNYGSDHPLGWGGPWKTFSADSELGTGQPLLVTNPLTDVNRNFKSCRKSAVATNGSVPNEPCLLPFPPKPLPDRKAPVWKAPNAVREGLLAVSLEAPLFHDGAISGIVNIGIDLKHIKVFLQQLKIGGPVEGHPSRSRVYITIRTNRVDPFAAGNIVGASHGSVVMVLNKTTNQLGPITPINSSDPIIREVATDVEANSLDLDEKAVTGSTTNMNITTSYAPGGEVFYYKVGRVVDENGADWYVHVVMDRAYILGEIDRKTTETRDTISAAEKKVEDDLDKARTLLYVLVIVVAVVLIVVSVVFVLKIIEPLVVLEREMAMVAVMKLEGVDTGRPHSSLHEVRLMQVSFLQMMKNLVEYRNYMPASVLQDESEDESESEATIDTRSNNTKMSQSARKTGSSIGTSVANRHTALGSMEAKQKRVTLMACNMLGFLDNKAKVLETISDYLAAGLVLVKGTKGIPDGFSGDRLYVSWNGVRPCSSHKTAAYKCARGFTMEKSLGKKFSIGIVSGDVKCGNMGCDGMKKFSFVGSLASWVHIVERVGRVRGSNITIDSVVLEEVANAAFTRLLQHVVYAKHSPKVLLLHEAMQEKEVQEEEWMYQLEEGEKQDKNAAYNTSFTLFMKGNVAEAIKALDGYTDTNSEVVKSYKEKLNAALTCAELCRPYGELERLEINMGQTVVFSLQGSAAAETISFSVTDSFLSKDKTINDLVRVQEGSTTQITVDVGRRSDADAAAWYKEKVQGNTEHTMYTGWGSPFPDELNFALEGVITVGGRSYQVWFGQGSPSIFQNNWYFASHDFKARDDNQSGYLDNRYYIKPNGSYTFELELTGEVCIGKTINLTAFTNATGVQPRFDLEGDVPYEFSLEQAPLQGVAAMRTGQTFDTTGISPAHRDFRTQVTDADDVKMVFTENMHRLDRVKGCLHGKTVAEQTLQRYTVSGTKMIKSWGVSNVSQPVEDQAYIYTSEDKSDWMQELTKKYASVRMCDLVLPASHDAGMYEVNFDPKLPRFLDLTLILLGPLGFLVKVLLIRESNNLENVMYNLGVTQKDNAYDQLTSGTRMFDFRPAYMTDREHKGTYHIHDFIPGCRFDTFLQDISRFLAEHKGEVVVVIIQPNGINTKHFSFLTKEEVVEFADENIDSDVGYTFQDDEDFAEFQTKKVTDMLDKRVIFLYEPSETNDSYNSEDHTASLTDPSAVLGTLAKTVQNNRNEKLTVLQLQNTGQGALLNHVRDIGLHLASWAHNLVYCKTGNILQATKPIFDSATYTWLTAPETVGHVKQQRCLVALLNDFVDVAMAEHAIALCHARQAAAPMAP